MKRKWFSGEHVVGVMKNPKLGTPIAGLIHENGITEQSFYQWVLP